MGPRLPPRYRTWLSTVLALGVLALPAAMPVAANHAGYSEWDWWSDEDPTFTYEADAKASCFIYHDPFEGDWEGGASAEATVEADGPVDPPVFTDWFVEASAVVDNNDHSEAEKKTGTGLAPYFHKADADVWVEGFSEPEPSLATSEAWIQDARTGGLLVDVDTGRLHLTCRTSEVS